MTPSRISGVAELSEARELGALGLAPHSTAPQYLAFYREGQRLPRSRWNKAMVPELVAIDAGGHPSQGVVVL